MDAKVVAEDAANLETELAYRFLLVTLPTPSFVD